VRRPAGRAAAALAAAAAAAAPCRAPAAQRPAATAQRPPPAAPAAVRAGRDELARVRAERAELETRLRALQTTAHDLRAEVSNLDRQADATARLVSALDRQLATIAAEEQEVGVRLAAAEAELTRQQVGLRRRLVDIYKRGPLYEAEALLSAASFGDLVARYKYLHELARRDRTLVARVERLRDDVAAQRQVLVRLQGELARNRDDRAAEEARLRAFGSRGSAALATVERQREGRAAAARGAGARRGAGGGAAGVVRGGAPAGGSPGGGGRAGRRTPGRRPRPAARGWPHAARRVRRSRSRPRRPPRPRPPPRPARGASARARSTGRRAGTWCTGSGAWRGRTTPPRGGTGSGSRPPRGRRCGRRRRGGWCSCRRSGRTG
jgi:hypothetical protein